MERSLEGNQQKRLIYYGLFRDEPPHKKVLTEMESTVFGHWDDLPSSPPKTRPHSQRSRMVDGLSIISCTSAGPIWPESLTTKFKADSAEGRELKALQEKFESEFPPPQVAPASGNTNGERVQRVSGQPDFSDGTEPLDISRLLDPLQEGPPSPGDRSGF